MLQGYNPDLSCTSLRPIFPERHSSCQLPNTFWASHRLGIGHCLFRVGLLSHGFFVGLAEGLGFTLLAVLLSAEKPPVSHPSQRPLHQDQPGLDTNLPLGETQVHLSTALGVGTGTVLEGPADRARSDSQVAVVAGSQVSGRVEGWSTRNWQELKSRHT